MTVASVLDRRIATALLQARHALGENSEWVARHTGWSISKVSRIENCAHPVRVSDLAKLLDLYNVPARRRAAILDLADQILAAGGKPWRGPGRPPETFTAANTILEWAPLTLPRLLRTSGYAAAVLTSQARIFPRPPGAVRALVEEITAPQARFERGGLAVRALIGEPALRRQFGDQVVMRQQVERILKVPAPVSVRVLPLDSDEVPGDLPPFIHASFTALAGVPVPDEVLVPQFGGDLDRLDEEDTVWRHEMAFEEMWSAAASETESRELLAAAFDAWGD